MRLTLEDLRKMRMQQERRDREELVAFMCAKVMLSTVIILLVMSLL